MDLPIELFWWWLHWQFYRYQYHVTVRFTFFNPIIIFSIMSSIYIDGSIYSRMNCTSNVIISVTVFVRIYTSLHYLAYFTLFILTMILSIYIDDIFTSVFINEVSDRKFWLVKSLQYTDGKNLLVFLFVFAKFLVMN